MKAYSIRVSFTDRRLGPGTGQTIHTTASTFHTAIKNAVRIFWEHSSHKEHNDVRRDGLKIEAREIRVDKTPEA